MFHWLRLIMPTYGNKLKSEMKFMNFATILQCCLFLVHWRETLHSIRAYFEIILKLISFYKMK